MKIASGRSSRCLAILILVSISGTAQNVTIYNNFLAGNTFVCCSGEFVLGTTVATAATLPGAFQAAAAFTPAGNFNLTQIDLALSFFLSGGKERGINITLNQDSGGVPGAALAAWGGLTAPSQVEGTSSLVTTVFPASTVALLAGKQYWIVASPASTNTSDFFLMNAVDRTGRGGRLAFNYSFGWIVQDVPSDGLAFDVRGTPTSEYFTNALRVPQIVDGGGWKMRFVIANTDQVPITFNVQFWAEDGTSLPFPVLNGTPGVLSGALEPGASYFAESPGTASILQQGWAEIASSGQIGVSAIYQFSAGGSRDSLGTEIAAPSTNTAAMTFDNTQGNATAIAIANTNPSQALTVSMLFATDNGVNSTISLVLPPHTRQAFVAASMNPTIAASRGSIKFSAPSPDMAVMGLQFTAGGQFTSQGLFQ
jgi:hypothetical protein